MISETSDNEIEKFQRRVETIIQDKRFKEREKFSGRKIVLFGGGRKGECDTNCADLILKDKCGYHKRITIQEYLYRKYKMASIILDNCIDSTEPILEIEKTILNEENVDVVVIFPDSSGPQLEFLTFKDGGTKAHLIVFVDEDHFPYGLNGGVLTSQIREFMARKLGLTIPIKKDKDLCELVSEVLTDHFRYN